MKKSSFITGLLAQLLIMVVPASLFCQNVGIGTSNPNSKAVLDIKATDKGILFPRLTSAQRNAITNPPNGLHVFNTDERCLSYYDSVYGIWNCYCETDTCKIVTIKISGDAVNLDFYNTYAIKYPGINKFVILITEDVYINSTGNGPAINFSTMPYPSNVTIKILNYGLIYGVSGNGGRGAAGQVGAQCSLPATNGGTGGHAITTNPGVVITIFNYGIVAGGGGGGGGGGRSAEGQYGGGGGGGAGLPFAAGGSGGGNTAYSICFPTCICGITGGNIAANGTSGTNVTGGTGGAGANGGGNGGNAGGLAQAGQNGTGTAAGTGGLPGKAISGSIGNSIINIGVGQSFGVVD